MTHTAVFFIAPYVCATTSTTYLRAWQDPYLTSQYAVTFVRALQMGEDARYLKVSATCKHYAAYSLEAWGGVERYGFDAIVTLLDEAETYLVGFSACIVDGAVSSLMCKSIMSFPRY